ncbi:MULTISPECIES: hypothetical protein [unclassified Kitasatospora]|uniref:hypothetical protein n=1 Tax=unclassified Kitasatospora TaxID=2633591 RepID=UPI000709B163|nr:MULTISPECIES: hypothetical protein [unclassified Kitasatospora]KQV21803.1 hypothetical protein ASC99_19165 [Kitasatospora sp. Root107]KRB75405.1 hypothetical protein ASE03_15590 [Kitasatospora sp. Root187]
MGELRGGLRVHFALAAVLGGAALLCMASTWLPSGYTAPKWLISVLFVMVFPVFITALIRVVTSRGAARRRGRVGAGELGRCILLLPPAVRLAYALALGAAVLGFATASGTARDVQADATGYHYTYWDKSAQPQQSRTVELTEPEYDAALRSQFRVFSAAPALFFTLSSFLVLVSASAGAAKRRAAQPPEVGPAAG